MQEKLEHLRHEIHVLVDTMQLCQDAGAVAVMAINLNKLKQKEKLLMEELIAVGDKVSKKGGDYRFDGIVVAVFAKLSGVERYVVEDDRGVLHIYGPTNLVKATA
jgi:hypothetical protein